MPKYVPADTLKQYMSLREFSAVAELMFDLENPSDEQRLQTARLMWTTMPHDLKTYARKPVRLFGRLIFRHRDPDPGHLAFLLGHYWSRSKRQWQWNGNLDHNTFRVLQGGHARDAVLIVKMIQGGTLSN